jgi:hypothetical protein
MILGQHAMWSQNQNMVDSLGPSEKAEAWKCISIQVTLGIRLALSASTAAI